MKINLERTFEQFYEYLTLLDLNICFGSFNKSFLVFFIVYHDHVLSGLKVTLVKTKPFR